MFCACQGSVSSILRNQLNDLLRLNTAADRLKLDVFHFKPTSCENAFSGSKLEFPIVVGDL
jgi:hypothetical protein